MQKPDEWSELTTLFGAVITIVGGIISILTAWNEHPTISLVCGGAVFVAGITMLLTRTRRSYRELRNGLRILMKQFRSQNFTPDIIIAFSRSGVTLAGMLSVNLGVEEIIAVTRQKGSDPATKRPVYDVGSKVNVAGPDLEKRKILVLFLVIDSAETLKSGLNYLEKRGINVNSVKIATFYISTGARNRWPDIVFAYESDDARRVLSQLPWIVDEYHYL